MNNNLGFARAVVWVCALLLSGILTGVSTMFFLDQDRWGPEEITEVFTVTDIPPDISRDALISTVDDVVNDAGVNVYKMSPFSQGDDRGTDYYLFAGNPSSVLGNPENGNFPTFSSGYPAALHDASALTRDRLLGACAVQGSSVQTQQIVDALARHQIVAAPVSSPPGVFRWPFFFLTSPWGIAAITLWIGLVLALVNQSAARLAIVGLRQATGTEPSRVLVPEATAVLAPAAACAAVMPLVLLTYSQLWVDGYQARSILTVGVLQALIPLSAALFAFVVAILAARRRSVGRILNGARPAGLLATLSVVAIVATAAGVGVSGASAVHRVIDEQYARSADEYRAQHPELVQPALGYAITSSQAPHIDEQLGLIYREMEAKDHVLLTTPGSLDSSGAVPSAALQERTLVVNTAFLASLPSADVEVIRKTDAAAQPGRLVVLVPSDLLVQQRDQLRSAVEQWVDFQISLRPTAEQVEPRVSFVENVNLGVVPRLDYDDSDNPMYGVDPVLIVTDASSGVLSNEFYAGLGAYSDGDVYQRLLGDHQVSHAVVSLRNVAQLSALDHADRRSELRVTLTGTAVMLLALILGSAVFAAVHHARRRTAVFLLSSTGSGYLGIHGKFTVLTAALAVIPASWGAAASSIPWVARIGVVVVCAAVVVVATVVTLGALQRSVNRTALEIS